MSDGERLGLQVGCGTSGVLSLPKHVFAEGILQDTTLVHFSVKIVKRDHTDILTSSVISQTDSCQYESTGALEFFLIRSGWL
jgi:hypothetical protein